MINGVPGLVVKAHRQVQIIFVCSFFWKLLSASTDCVQRGRCSDGVFETLLNNSLQLHSALNVCKGKIDNVALLKDLFCNLPFLICQSLITAFQGRMQSCIINKHRFAAVKCAGASANVFFFLFVCFFVFLKHIYPEIITANNIKWYNKSAFHFKLERNTSCLNTSLKTMMFK